MATGAAVAVAAALAWGMVPIGPPDRRPAVAVAGGLALALTTAAALGWRRALAWALVAFVVEYALALASRPALDLRAPLVAAGLLVVGELASLAPNLGGTEPAPRRVSAQVFDALGFGLGAVALGALVLAVATNSPRVGILVQAASAAAAVGLLLLITRLAKKRPETRG
jgi:hypothetical protein